MSPQIIELLIFAGIAFFLVNKLLSILGTTTEHDKNRSTFGEQSGLKDITDKADVVDLKPVIDQRTIANYVVNDNIKEIMQNLQVVQKMCEFDIAKFVSGAKNAFKMLIMAFIHKDQEAIDVLVDKRFLKQFMSFASKYNSVDASQEVEAKVSELYTFGNNIFVKVLFSDISSKLGSIKEEWTFSKSANSSGSAWHLNNIDVIT